MLLVSLLWLGTALTALGHGVTWAVQEGSRAISVLYQDGTPFADAEVMVYAPDDPTLWLIATTDLNGHFAFVPDRAGRWRLVVNDGMGHGETILLDIADDLALLTATPPARPRGLALIAGIGIIIALAGLAYAFYAKKTP